MITLKSCKSTAQQMTVVAVDERGREASAFITVRTCGGPFLQHDAAVGSLLTDLFTALAALDAPVAAPEAYELRAPAVDNVEPVEGTLAAPRKGKTLPPKGAA